MENEGVDIFLEDIMHVSRLQLSQSKLFEFFLVFWILGMNLVIWDMCSLIMWKLSFAGSSATVPLTCRHQLDPVVHLCVVFLASF